MIFQWNMTRKHNGQELSQRHQQPLLLLNHLVLENGVGQENILMNKDKLVIILNVLIHMSELNFING